jgi:hypothetical protein
MRTIRFKLFKYKDCKTCFGEGSKAIGLEPSFNSRTMEIEARDIMEHCEECAERSQDDYEYAIESQRDAERDEDR